MVHASGHHRYDRLRAARFAGRMRRRRARRWYRKSRTTRALMMAQRAWGLARMLMPEMKFIAANGGDAGNVTENIRPLNAHAIADSGVDATHAWEFSVAQPRGQTTDPTVVGNFYPFYGISDDLCLISQGDGNTNRDGESVRSRGIWLDLHFYCCDASQTALTGTRVPTSNETTVHVIVVEVPGVGQPGYPDLTHTASAVYTPANIQRHMLMFLYNVFQEPMTNALNLDPVWRHSPYRDGRNTKDPAKTYPLEQPINANADTYWTDTATPNTGYLVDNSPRDHALRTRGCEFKILYHQSFIMGTPQNTAQAPITDVHIKKMIRTNKTIEYETSDPHTARTRYHVMIMHNGTTDSSAQTAGTQNRIWLDSKVRHFYQDV